MTDKEILNKAIQKAIDGGWTMWEWPHYDVESSGLYVHFSDGKKSWESKLYITKGVKSVIFNHDFAKALWPLTPNVNYEEYTPAWKIHLQKMVIADDPLKYLGDHI